MGKRGNVLTDFALIGFYLMFAAVLGISFLIFTENVKQKTDFYVEKDAVDIAASLNVVPLASGKLEIKHFFRPEYSYKIKDNKVTVTKTIPKSKYYASSNYTNLSLEETSKFVVLKNE